MGYALLEFSYTFHKFMNNPGNRINLEVIGGRRLENGLVIPAMFHIASCREKILKSEMEHKSAGEHINIEICNINIHYTFCSDFKM